jgi:uncharacterized membrane protein
MIALSIVLLLLQVGITTLPCLPKTEARNEQSRIAGVVLDRNDSRIAGAVITIKNPEFVRHLRSDYEGRFELELPAGSYEIRVEKPGFKTFNLPSVRADAGITAQINIHLEVQPPKEPLEIRF